MPFSLVLFFLSIGAIFFSDVFNTYKTSQLSFLLVLLTPALLFLSAKMEKKKIYVPVKETAFYLLFIIFSTISTFLAINKDTAVQLLLTYYSGYLFFIFAFNYQENLNKYFKWFLIIISVFSSLIFLINKIYPLRLFKDGASLFYNGYYHNEVGNVIILGILICFYLFLFKKKNVFIALLLFFLPFFIFSYSRSAYLAIIVVGTILLFIKKNWLLVALIILITGLFFVTTKEVNRFFPTSVRKFVEKRLLLPKEKSFTGKRQQHFYYALLAATENPFFGIGPNNLYSLTGKYQFNWEEQTNTAHNFILDIIAENGTLAGISFLMFLALLFIKMKKNLYYYLFFSLTLIFLFDFSYRYPSVFLFWIILAAISLPHDKDNLKINNAAILLSIITLFIFSQIILISKGLYNLGLVDLSLKIYPLNKETYRKVIEANIRQGEKTEALKNITKFNSVFNKGSNVNLNIGKYYEDLNEKKQAIYFYEKAVYDRPLLTSTILSKIVFLNVSLYGEDVGRVETEKFINQFKKDVKIPKNSDVEKIIKNYCYDYKLKCQ